jgi:hypothetical protein
MATMESTIKNNNLPELIQSNEDKRELKFIHNIWVRSAFTLVLLFVVGLFAFQFGREKWNFDTSIDASIWGSFGEFIGGFLGTIVAFMSVFFLVRTLKNQIKSNEEITKNNKEIAKNNAFNTEIYKLQQFHDTFTTLVSLYHGSIEAFQNNDDKKGKKIFHEEVKELQEKFTETEKDYDKLTKKTITSFNTFYTKYREYASVYFRLLYRIFQLIDSSDISEKKKSEYAKIVRCQLSEDEMFLLRYNAMTTYGKKMQNYVNRYNLLKHLPVMNLLEFSTWRNKVTDTEKNYLDSLFIDLRKKMCILLENEEKIQRDTEDKKYSIRGEIKESNTFKIEVIKQKKSKSGTNDSLSIALDKFSENEFSELIMAFVKEVFIYSNFQVYAKNSDMTIETDIDTAKKKQQETFWVTIKNKNNYPLILSQIQLAKPKPKPKQTNNL